MIHHFEVCWGDAVNLDVSACGHHWHFKGWVISDEREARSYEWARACCWCGEVQHGIPLGGTDAPAAPLCGGSAL